MGCYIFAGTSNSFDGDVSGNHGYGFDACIMKLDNSGNIQWQRCYGGSTNEEAYDIQLTSDGGSGKDSKGLVFKKNQFY